jgi:hypothetical protein
MDISKISAEDWRKFRERFPSAESFLTAASLRGELRHLRATFHRTAWQDARLAELEAWNSGSLPVRA